ncbi:hypothetical protein JXA47_11275 [Candidatus Sumerlaeota bacterium]|nr:hypothetical protein [Candidatus Sumerlaeota bacterium]
MRWHLWTMAPLVICLSACGTWQTTVGERAAPAPSVTVQTEPAPSVTPRIEGMARFALTPETQWQAIIEYEDVAIGQSPAGWLRVTAGGVEDATWEVMQGPEVPSRTHVLGVTAPSDAPRDAVHMLWTDKIGFEDGTVRVDVLPRGGERCQSVGLAWRVQDGLNYYVCRWDALARDLMLGVVVNGELRTLGTWTTDLAVGEWHRIQIEHTVGEIKVQFAGAERLEAQDNTLIEAGGVGLWTEGDSQAAFDGLIVQPGGGS